MTGCWPKLDHCGHKRVRIFISAKVVGMIASALVLIFCLSVRADNGSVMLTISDPNPAPVVGGTFETTLKFSTEYTVLGAYHTTIHYDSSALKILQVTTPAESEFHDNTFIDTNSFSTGETAICAFQTENWSEQPSPETFATVRWELLAEPTPCTKIYLVPETLTDAFWEPIEGVNSSVLLLNENTMPPNVDFFKIPGTQRSTVHYFEVQFEKHAVLSRDALIIEGQQTGIVDLSGAAFSYWHHSYDAWPATTAYWILPTSLPDDIYTATIVATEVKLASDQSVVLDGDGDCLPGGDYVTTFHRLFGDATGDAVVNYEDLLLSAPRWLNTPGYTGLDANEDNIINFFDFAVFAKNWLKNYE